MRNFVMSFVANVRLDLRSHQFDDFSHQLQHGNLRLVGKIERLAGEGWPGTISVPTLSAELYRSARWLRVFTARRTTIPLSLVTDILGA